MDLTLLVLCFFTPCLVALRGLGSRKVWLGGGVLSFVGLCLYFVLWSMPTRPTQPGEIAFDPVLIYPPSLPLGGADGYCIAAALGFVLAGLLFRPKKEASASLLGNHEGRILNAGRANGKSESD